jgi:hypothetical protein
MVSNDRQSGNRNAIVAGPQHGSVSLRSKRSWHKFIKYWPQAMQKGHNRDESYLPSIGTQELPASRLIAGALAIIIFVIDTFTPLDIAIAVLYVIVVLMAANFLRRRGVILVGLACAALTLLSFMLERGYWDTSDSLGRTLVSLTAIGVTTVLALIWQRAEDAWRRSETYLTDAQRLSRTGSFSWKIATEEQVWSEEIYRIYEYDLATKPTLDLVRRRSHPDDASMLEQAPGCKRDTAHRYNASLADAGWLCQARKSAGASGARCGKQR